MSSTCAGVLNTVDSVLDTVQGVSNIDYPASAASRHRLFDQNGSDNADKVLSSASQL